METIGSEDAAGAGAVTAVERGEDPAPPSPAVPPAVADAARKVVGISYAGEIPSQPERPPADFTPFPTMP